MDRIKVDTAGLWICSYLWFIAMKDSNSTKHAKKQAKELQKVAAKKAVVAEKLQAKEAALNRSKTKSSGDSSKGNKTDTGSKDKTDSKGKGKDWGSKGRGDKKGKAGEGFSFVRAVTANKKTDGAGGSSHGKGKGGGAAPGKFGKFHGKGGSSSSSSFKDGQQQQQPRFAGTKRKAGEASGRATISEDATISQKKKHMKQERQSQKPNFELVEDLKTSWNKIRVKATASTDRSATVDKMVKKMKGKVLSVTLRHDAARIVQSIFQFGTVAQRVDILNELAGKIFEISKTPYGHFVVLKAITYCIKPEEQKKIASALQNHFVALGTNVIGARTVESIMQLYPANLTKALKAEFYGKVR